MAQNRKVPWSIARSGNQTIPKNAEQNGSAICLVTKVPFDYTRGGDTMQLGGNKIRVKLKVDLTKYDKRLVEGSLGYTMPDIKLDVWGWQDRYVAVKFDCGACLDVRWEGLEKLI